MIGKGQIAQKRQSWDENILKSKSKGNYTYLVVFWKRVAAVPMLLQMVNGSRA